jgi:hypothetical protein
MLSEDAEPQRWDRGAWIRLGIAVMPLIAIAIVGIFYVR